MDARFADVREMWQSNLRRVEASKPENRDSSTAYHC